MGQVESIEILKGGLSTFYGTGAATPVINIKTKEAEKEGIHGKVGYGFGSFNTRKFSANVNGTQDKLSYVVSGGLWIQKVFLLLQMRIPMRSLRKME